MSGETPSVVSWLIPAETYYTTLEFTMAVDCLLHGQVYIALSADGISDLLTLNPLQQTAKMSETTSTKQTTFIFLYYTTLDLFISEVRRF